MREVILSLSIVGIVTIVSLGCGTTSGGGASTSSSEDKTSDGLIRVKTDRPGDLYLRENHGIGGYDAVVIAPSFVNYRRSSSRLDEDLEIAYLAALEQSLFDAATEAGAPIVNAVGPCVLTIGIGFVNVELARSNSADVLGTMILVMQYQDSVSGEALLRYAAPKQIDRESEGTSREDQISQSFDRMIAEVDIITALRIATKTPSPPQPGCRGDLVRAGLPAEGTAPTP